MVASSSFQVLVTTEYLEYLFMKYHKKISSKFLFYDLIGFGAFIFITRIVLVVVMVFVSIIVIVFLLPFAIILFYSHLVVVF